MGRASLWESPGQTVPARLIEYHMWHPPADSVAQCGEDSEKGQWPLPVFVSGRNLFPSFCLDARNFSSSLYATGAFQATTPVLELRVSKSE